MFDIKIKGDRRRAGDDMDALTSFELEALRRRETVANDRDTAWARAMAAPESADPVEIRPGGARATLPGRLAADGDCQPATLARQSAG